jgi:hypothetical protein
MHRQFYNTAAPGGDRIETVMTRRDFILAASAVPLRRGEPAPLLVPIHRIMDSRGRCTPEELHNFWWSIWPEAVRNFGRAGIGLQTTDGPGEVKRSPGDMPIFVGLQPGVVNLVLTDHIPLKWDNARALAGVTTIHGGYHVCLIALRYAHGDQVPFISVNTCVHELLHALLQDVYVRSPKWYQGGEREFRTDWYASCMWLFHTGSAVRNSAQAYLARLRPR